MKNCSNCIHWNEKFDNIGICDVVNKPKNSFELCEFFISKNQSEFIFLCENEKVSFFHKEISYEICENCSNKKECYNKV